MGDFIFQLSVNLPDDSKLHIMVSTEEQVQDIRQSIMEAPNGLAYTCFHLKHKAKRVNDFVRLSEVEGISPESELTLVEDSYTEKDARVHVLRVRDLMGAAGDRTDNVRGAFAGLSLYESVTSAASGALSGPGNAELPSLAGQDQAPAHAMAGFNPVVAVPLSQLLPPKPELPPKTVKSLSVSPWNPPPYSYRQRGHLLYLLLTTLEGEQFHITSAVWGFFVNRSSNAKFDPLPRASPRNAAAHSLLDLLRELSPAFSKAFAEVQALNSEKDPLAAFQPPNAIPASPWFVPPSASPQAAHVPDLTRTQESFLVAGIENAETLRDWNEEFQSTRELPRETVQDRLFRERLTSKLFADYNDAAVRGAVLVARGEVPALNPTESSPAQIFLFNNVFLSFGADGAGTFITEGGDEAARAATGKDVSGVKIVNQLDMDGLFTPGTVVVDYLGKRIVGQTIVPGIFKQREPDDHQIDYGAVDGKDVIAKDETFTPLFEKLSRAMHLKKHTVWDKDAKPFELDCSVETKGLLGTDGRRYVLDLYRITPLDIDWIEKHWRSVPLDHTSSSNGVCPEHAKPSYPHRVAVLRPELIDAYHKSKLRQYTTAELDRRKSNQNEPAERPSEAATSEQHTNGGPVAKSEEPSSDKEKTSKSSEIAPSGEQDRVDTSNFHFALNPDAFSGQQPREHEEVEQLAKDEEDVRAAGQFLVSEVIPQLMRDLSEGDVGFPMDGRSLSRLLHKRGVNIRYLGTIHALVSNSGSRLQALKELTEREMVSRVFKHIANRYLRSLPVTLVSHCVAHLLNCLLGADLNQSPTAFFDESLTSFYDKADIEYLAVTPQTLQNEVSEHVYARFRHQLDADWHSAVKRLQLLREVALKLGIQLEAREYNFHRKEVSADGVNGVAINGGPAPLTSGHSTSNGKKKHRTVDTNGGLHSSTPDCLRPTHAFIPEDIVNVVPVVKETSPKSSLAEETFEAVRLSFAQDQKEIGQELLFETLALHEQIYGILHPEVSRFYSQLSMFYYQLEEKKPAVEIARKAVVVSERTLGVDSAETILAYLNLGLFEHAAGNTRIALAHMRHALELWKIVYGSDHPDAVTTTSNIAVMLQQLQFYHDSRAWFEASLEISERIFGKQSVNTGTFLFQLAQALALDNDSKGAVGRMRDAYNIFLSSLGRDHKLTNEAEGWLEQLTKSAVSIARHAKDLRSRKIRRVHFNTQVAHSTRPHLEPGQSQSEATNPARPEGTASLDSRSIDELMQFIEGGTKSTRVGPEQPRRSNPKRRGGAAVRAAG